MSSPRRRASFALVLFLLLLPVSGVFAQDLFDDLFGGGDSYRSAPSRSRGYYRDTTSGQFRDGGRRRRELRDTRRSDERRAAAQNEPYGDPSGSEPGAAAGGEFCVRACDGYFFPLIRSARATKQQSCAFACPSATVEYYHGGSIDSARNLRGQRYTELPNAFKYREQAVPGCACHPPGQSQQTSLRIARKDPTAQAGDIVVEDGGAYVFNGNRIVPLEGSHEVSAAVRRDVKRMTDGPGKVAYAVVVTQRPATAVRMDVAPVTTPAITPPETPQAVAEPLTAAAPASPEPSAARLTSGDAEGRAPGGGVTILFAILAVIAAAFVLVKRRRRVSIHAPVVARANHAQTTDGGGAAARVDSAPPLAWVWSCYRGQLESLGPAEDESAPLAWVWSAYRGELFGEENFRQSLTTHARREAARNDAGRLFGAEQAAAA